MTPTTRILGNLEAWLFRYTGDVMKGWRTMAIGLGFTAIGAALLVFADPERADMGVSLIMTGMSMVGMRVVTDTEIGDKV